MERKAYKKGQVIFRRGDAGDCMYDLDWGKVGFFLNYGTDREEKLSELDMEGFFGEMGLVEHEARSADAVALEDSYVRTIREEDLGRLFAENPAKLLLLMQYMSGRLRKLTKNYVKVCQTIAELSEAEEKNGGAADEETIARERYFTRLAQQGEYFV